MSNTIDLIATGSGRYALRLNKQLAQFGRSRTTWYNTIKGVWQKDRTGECESNNRDELLRTARIQAAVKRAELKV